MPDASSSHYVTLTPIWNVTLAETHSAQREGKSENKSCLSGFWVRASAA